MTDDPHIIHLQGRVDRLESDVTEIKAGVKTLLNRPQNPGFSQVIGTLLATLATCSIIFAFAEWRIIQAVDPVSTLSQEAFMLARDNKIKAAVFEERSRWLENKLTITTIAK